MTQLAFSPSGHKLATVGMDDEHCLAVYEWEAAGNGGNGKALFTGRVSRGRVLDVHRGG